MAATARGETFCLNRTNTPQKNREMEGERNRCCLCPSVARLLACVVVADGDDGGGGIKWHLREAPLQLWSHRPLQLFIKIEASFFREKILQIKTIAKISTFCFVLRQLVAAAPVWRWSE